MTRTDISNAIVEALDLPYYGHRRGPGWRIANAFIQSMTNLILSGEPVEVTGFGIFRLKSRAAHTKTVHLNGATYIASIPKSTFVVFTPSPSLLRYLNKPNEQ